MIRRHDLHDLRTLFVGFAKPYLPLLALTVVISLVVAFLTSVQPLVLAPAIESALLLKHPPAPSWRELDLNNLGSSLLAWTGVAHPDDRWTVLVIVVVAYLGVVGLGASLNFGNMLLIGRIRTDISRDMQVTLYRHLLGLSMSYFVRQRSGDLSSRLVNDTVQTATTVDPVIRGLLQGSTQLIFYTVLILRTDVRLTVTVLAVIVAHLLITRILRDKIRRLVVGQFDLLAELTSIIHEALLSIRVVKSFGAEKFEHRRFERGAQRLGGVMFRGGVYKYVEVPLREIADAIGIGVVLLIAFGALVAGRLTVPGLMLFVLIVRQAFGPASQIGSSVLLLQTMIGSSRRLLAVMRERPKVVDGTREAVSLRDAIRLHNVSFAYDSGVSVLRDISLEIRRGETIALVGPSGGGKSTLADLILRLHDPTSGSVTYDGVDVRLFSQEGYRRRFGVVSQECLLFNATVEENIAYGRGVDREAVVRATRIAHADGFIRELPHGYDTVVGDRGIRLSGGQRQRIAIARAIYGNPDVLILDEATSSLDSESERHVQSAIEEVARDITAIVIAHRLSTVVNADRIVLLNRGEIDAIGAHDELLATSALYRRLCEAQFREPPEVGGQIDEAYVPR